MSKYKEEDVIDFNGKRLKVIILPSIEDRPCNYCSEHNTDECLDGDYSKSSCIDSIGSQGYLKDIKLIENLKNL